MKTIGDALAAKYVSLVIHRPGGAEQHRLFAYPEDKDLNAVAELLANLQNGGISGVSLTRDRAELEPAEHDDERWLWGERS